MRTRMPRTLLAAAACSALLFTAAGCGNDPEPIPSSSAKPTPSETAPAWQSKYSEKQIKAYDEALARFTEYETKAEPIWADGKATVAAKSFFEEYFLNPDEQYATLQSYDMYDVQLSGLPKVISSEPIELGDPDKGGQGLATTIRQCVDYRTTTTMQNGEVAPKVESRQKPVLREIRLMKVGNVKWLISNIDTKPGGKDTPC